MTDQNFPIFSRGFSRSLILATSQSFLNYT